MLRSVKDSDDDTEAKRDRTRLLAGVGQAATVNSPLRRSSRLKQNRATSVSPGSDTSSIYSTQLTRVTRKRASNMDLSEMSKEQRSRKTSVSSDISETIETETPGRRTTRRNSSSIMTPTKMGTRASKRFIRAGSEAKSPSPSVRTTRRTRSTSVEPEIDLDQHKSQLDTPMKIRRRASVAPANSPVKEEVEDHLIPYVRLDLTILETEEPINSANSDSSPDKLQNFQQNQKASEKRKSLNKSKTENKDEHENIDSSLEEKLLSSPENPKANTRKSMKKDKVKEDDNHATSASVSQSNETFSISKENEISDKNDADTITVDNKENLGDPNCLPDKVSQSQTSQKIKKRKSKDNIEKDNSQEENLDQSRDKNELHNISVDKSKRNEKSLDNNDMNLALEKESACHNTDEVSSDIINLNSPKLIDLNISLKESNQSVIEDKQLAQNNSTTENLDLIKQKSQKTMSKLVRESKSPSVTETIEKITHNNSKENIKILQELSDSSVAEELMQKSSEAQSIKKDNEDNTNETSDINKKTKNKLQLEKIKGKKKISYIIVDNDSEDSDIDIHDRSVEHMSDEKKEKISEKNDSAENNQEYSQLIKEEQNSESEAECDLILVDKQAWLAAENMKIAKEVESSEYDSDDTIVKKSKLDAARANRTLTVVDEEILNEETVSPKIKKFDKMPEEKSRKDINSSIVKDVNSSNDTDKSLDDYENQSLNRSNKDCSASKLNKFEQLMKGARRLSKTHHESDQEVEDNADKLNKSLRTNKENISRRKSLQERKSLNESLKDTSLKHSNKKTQDVFMDECPSNKSQEDMMKISQERHSLNKSEDNEDNIIEERKSEKKKKKKSLSSRDNSKIEQQACLERSMDEKSKAIMKLVRDDDENSDNSENSETVERAMDIKFDNCSIIARAGSLVIDSDDKNIFDNNSICSEFAKNNDNNSNDTDKDNNSIDSDVKNEYNLDGAEQKFDDDNVPHDVCRASESEYSDSNDNGSDLADFIVDDGEEEEDDDEEEEEQEKNDDEEQEDNDEDEQNEEEKKERDIKSKERRKRNAKREQIAEVKDVMNKDEDADDKSEDEEKKRNIKSKERRKRNAKREQIAEVKDIMNEDEDADDEQSEVEIDSNDGSDESNDDESLNIINESKKDKSIEFIFSHLNEAKSKQITKKSHTKKNEENILLDTSNSNVFNKSKKTDMSKNEESMVSSESSLSKKKRKSLLRRSDKIEMEQDSPKELDKSATSQLSKKLSKLHVLECSTPKLDSSKHKLKFTIETPEALEKSQENKDKLDKDEATQNKKRKSKDSTINISSTDQKNFEEKSLNINLSSDSMKIMRKESLSKPTVSKTAELNKTIDITHSETPTIRHLRKEKLSETTPALKLHVEVDQSPSTAKNNENVVETEECRQNDDVFNLELSNNSIQKSKKQKKRKKRTEEISNENENKEITDEALPEDTIELQAFERKKRMKLSESLNIKDDICKDTSQNDEEKKEKKKRKKRKKKKQVGESEENNKDIKEAESMQNETNETELIEYKKMKTSDNLKSSTSTNDQATMKKKSEQQERKMAQSEETSLEELPALKKNKKQKTKKEAPLESKLSEAKSKSPNKPHTTESNMIELRNAAFAKARQEALEALRVTQIRIKANKELKEKTHEEKKKNRERAFQIQKQNLQERNTKVNKKRKKEDIEDRSALSSTSNLERLSDDVIKNLSDTRAAKRQKLSKEKKEKPIPQPQTSKAKKMQLSYTGGTTQFSVMNLQKIEKSKTIITERVASFRQRMLDRNKREPVSAYLMYLEKQRALKKNKGPSNIF